MRNPEKKVPPQMKGLQFDYNLTITGRKVVSIVCRVVASATDHGGKVILARSTFLLEVSVIVAFASASEHHKILALHFSQLCDRSHNIDIGI